MFDIEKKIKKIIASERDYLDGSLTFLLLREASILSIRRESFKKKKKKSAFLFLSFFLLPNVMLTMTQVATTMFNF